MLFENSTAPGIGAISFFAFLAKKILAYSPTPSGQRNGLEGVEGGRPFTNVLYPLQQ